jgi:hypothetical protein
MAHYQCELALEADAKGDTATADRAAGQGPGRGPEAARPASRAACQRLAQGTGRRMPPRWPPGMACASATPMPSAGGRRVRRLRPGLPARPTPRARRLLVPVPPGAGMDLLRALATLDGTPPALALADGPAARPAQPVGRAGTAGRAACQLARQCPPGRARCRGPCRPRRCSATAARPAASRPSATSGNARAAWAGTPSRPGGWKNSE